LEPYHVRAFVEPKQLKVMATPPGSPFIKRVGPHTGRASILSMADPSMWTTGMCGDYALALQELRPDLRIGMHVESYPNADLNPFTTDPEVWSEAMDNEEQGWTPNHVFAHDDRYAYDALGRHPLPYDQSGLHTQLNLTREDVEAQGWPEGFIDEAKQHIRENNILS
jgi:hypothetical protein